MLHNVLSAHCKQPRQLTASRRDPGEGSLPSVPAPPLAFAPFSLKTATAVHYKHLDYDRQGLAPKTCSALPRLCPPVTRALANNTIWAVTQETLSTSGTPNEDWCVEGGHCRINS